MWRDIYIAEKLRDLSPERDSRKDAARAALAFPSRRSQPLKPFVRLTGRTLRRVGEGLEAWAAIQHEPSWQRSRCEGR